MKYFYLVETVYNKVCNPKEGEGNKMYLELAGHTMSFENDNKSAAHHEAKTFMDNTRRYGLKLNGGAVILSVIHPSAILQIGLVDGEILQEEQRLVAEANTSLVPSDVEVVPTPVDTAEEG